MSSLYKFDAKLKSMYPNLKTYVDSKVVQQIMEEIIYEEPSISFIKSYLKDKGYINVDSQPEDTAVMKAIAKNTENDNQNNKLEPSTDIEVKKMFL